MSVAERLLRNHPLANICFAVVLLLGVAAYATMPREQDPEINFNWVSIVTVLPGASAEDIERLVTDPLEDAIKGVADIRFVASNSREGASSILVRFREIGERTFDKRINDLRREIQNKAASELPRDAKDPQILEITTSNGFPTAILVLKGQADDETLRANARAIRIDLERMAGVDTVFASGLRDPELQVRFDARRLAARGLNATDLSDAVGAWFRDTSAGSLRAGDSEWLVRLEGQSPDPERLAKIPVRGEGGAQALLEDVATAQRARARPTQLASSGGRPSITFAVNKKSLTNTLALVERLDAYIAAKQPLLAASGLELGLADDQTVPTRNAISVMENNAWQGWLLVMAVCWLFLGWKVALLVALGIPFSLAGTFAVLDAFDFTLNISVLLGSVIALGMLVDDAVVVVESIYYRIERGEPAAQASLNALREVWSPVVSSVATTLAAFLPLMLLPGIVGKFMFVIPFVVTLALLISLAEAFWMLPTHVTALDLRLSGTSRPQRLRNAFNRRIRLAYGRALAKLLRHPYLSLVAIVVLVAAAAAAIATERVRVQFFAFDPLRIFYVNVDMPPSASIEDTLAEVERVEVEVRRHLRDDEPRSVTSTAGIKFTETEPLYGDTYGQVIVSLLPRPDDGREVAGIVAAMREAIETMPGPGRKSFLQLSGGPPLTRPVSIKVRGDDYTELRAAVDRMLAIVRGIDGTRDVVDDDIPGRPELNLVLDREAVRGAGLDAGTLSRLVRLSADGEVVSILRSGGDRIEVRVQAQESARPDIGALLAQPVALPRSLADPDGGTIALGSLVSAQARHSKGVIKHYNLRRTITVEADLDKAVIDTAKANALIRERWEAERERFPGVDLDYSGELEDVQESLDAMGVLFAFGVGLIYLILAAQFRSYLQPLMILVTVPLAFTGVTIGLFITGNPLSLFTMYGVIALTGIAVNSAIVLIAATNERREAGRSIAHAVVQAGRRRVIPVLITSLTTIAGLFALAAGFGGKSLLWGPVASSIVWGLGVATILTLFVVPILYGIFMRPVRRAM
ncbi:MAG TPA: efflux RND transporter permease subunit [Burkholderiaceae bacterium]|nr:efflux RND transporter permease subunit [Burkholderiaceae bacterium]